MSERARNGAGVWAVAGVVAVSVTAALGAVLEMLLVPVYAGSTLVPVGAGLALLANALFPRLAFALVARPLAAAAPFVTWLATVVGFGVLARPEGDVILPGGSAQWGSYLLLLGGALVGTITVVTAVPPRQPVNGSRLPSRKAS